MIHHPRCHPRLVLCLLGAMLCLAVGGCNSVPSAGLQTLAATVGLSPGSATQFVPGIAYLRADWGAGEAYLVLGDVDGSIHGPTQVFYSAGRQVLRLHRGRVAGSYGLPVDWPAVAWTELPASWRMADAEAVWYERTRDQSPSQRMGVREGITLRRTTAPAHLDLPGVDRAQWQRWAWYSEEATPLLAEGIFARESTTARGVQGQSTMPAAVSTADILPPALFAVDLDMPGEPVRFSYQCLSPDFCLRLQPLPPGPPPAQR